MSLSRKYSCITHLSDTSVLVEDNFRSHANSNFRRFVGTSVAYNNDLHIAAEKYAAARGWEGFGFVLKTQSCQEYIRQIFDGLAMAAARPTGYAALQYTAQAGELRRIAEAHGILDVYDQSGGKRLDGLFIR